MILTIRSLETKLTSIIGNKYSCPITKNKGLPGLFLEDLLEIPHSSRCLDCEDGEVKTVPLKKNKKGELLPKETVAVTMLSTDDLTQHDFNTSRCGIKLARVLIIPYIREGDNIEFLKPVVFDKSIHTPIYDVLEQDYNAIRQKYIDEKILQSGIGKYLQTRTKGTGHGSTSRAFYLRTQFIKDFVKL